MKTGHYAIESKRHHDLRGFFTEIYHAGDVRYVQASHSRSRHNSLRGLHYRKAKPQHRLITVMQGSVLDVVVDMRRDGEFGKWYSYELSDNGVNQIYVAPGLAHGFYVLSQSADLLYQTSELYDPHDECGIAWDDPELAIPWPSYNPLLSKRDETNPTWRELFP